MGKYLFNGSITHAYHDDGISDLCLDNQIKSDISCFRHKIQTNNNITNPSWIPFVTAVSDMDIWSVFLHNIFCQTRGNPSYLSVASKIFRTKTRLSLNHRIAAGARRAPGPAPSVLTQPRGKGRINLCCSELKSPWVAPERKWDIWDVQYII